MSRRQWLQSRWTIIIAIVGLPIASSPWSLADPCAPQPPTTSPVGNAVVIEFEVCDRGKMAAVATDGQRFAVVYERAAAEGPCNSWTSNLYLERFNADGSRLCGSSDACPTPFGGPGGRLRSGTLI